MSCDNSTFASAIDLDPCLSLRRELGKGATAGEMELERHSALKRGRLCLAADQSNSNRHRHVVQSRIIPDSTQTEPEYVWGDEGPIND